MGLKRDKKMLSLKQIMLQIVFILNPLLTQSSISLSTENKKTWDFVIFLGHIEIQPWSQLVT